MNKKGKIIIVFLIIIFISLVAFLILSENERKSHYLYLFTGTTDKVKWYYNDNKWYISNTNKIQDELFDVYSDSNYEGKYNLVYNGMWYYFDKDNISHKFLGNNYMINTNYNYTFFKFVKNSIYDNDIVIDVKKALKIDNKNYDVSLNKYDIFENEDIKTIYTILFIEESDEYEVKEPSYSAIFTYKNKSISMINSHRNNSKFACRFDLVGVMKFQNKNNKLLVGCEHYDQIPKDYYLYEQNGDNYKILINSNGGI